MPWTKVLCSTNEEKTFAECLECPRECFDLEIREALFANEANQDPAHVGESISVTGLLGCLRNTYLERTIPYSAPPKSMWWALRGQLIHKIVERPDFENESGRRMTERRLTLPIPTEDGEVLISGQLDVWRDRFLKEGILKDWKSTGDNGLRYIIQGGAKWEHVWQTNIYRKVLTHNGYNTEKIRISYLSLMDVVTTGTEAVLNEYLVNEPLPTGFRANMKRVRLAKEYPSGKKQWACYYDIPEVPLYKEQDVIDFITPRALALHRAFRTGVAPGLPDISDVDPKDAAKLHNLSDIRNGFWKCNGYCHVWKECQALTPGWDGPSTEE